MGSLSKTSAALFLLFLLTLTFIGFFLPKPESIEIVKTINCKPNQVFTLVNELKNWEKWSPWMEKDPEMKLSYSDSSFGPGASYSWAGNSQVGFGKLTILSTTENQQINMMLKYADYPETPCSFKIEPLDNGSKVAWSINSGYSKNWFGKNILGGYKYIMMNHFMKIDFGRGIDNIEAICNK